jgi:autotransporter-associated beta strand protein
MKTTKSSLLTVGFRGRNPIMDLGNTDYQQAQRLLAGGLPRHPQVRSMQPKIFSRFATTALTFSSLLGSTASSRAELLVAEDFTYADGGLNGQNGGKGLREAWNSTVHLAGGVPTGNSASTRGLVTSFPSSGTLWLSFDWGFASNPHPQSQFGGITFFEGNMERCLIGDVWDTGVWSVNGGSATSETNHGGMKTGVAKITLGAGETSTVELWVGPIGSPVDVSGAPIATATGRDLDGVDSLRIMGSSFDANINQSFDNLLIGTTVADVDAIAVSATWTNPGGGLWGKTGNWLNQKLPTDHGGTVDFSTLNITADTTIQLDAAQTSGDLAFGDTDPSSPAGWTLTGNILTMAGTTPTITVNALGGTKSVMSSAVIAGTSGLTKAGPGTLILTGANNYSGTTKVDGGSLQIGNGGPSGTLGSGPVTLASGATLTFHRSDDLAQSETQIISGAGTLIKDGKGTLTLTGRNTHSGTTTVKSGVLAVENQAALGEGPLNLGSGAKLELNFSGQSYVTQLTIGGAVQAEGTYGSSKSSATTKSDTVFSGTGIITVRASIDHVAMATANMTAADAAWTAGDWAKVRSALVNVFTNLRLTAQWRSIAHLRYARSFQAAGDFANASAVFGTIAAIKEYPRIHQMEGAECKTECERLAQKLPARDPEASQVRVTPAPTPGRILYVAPDGNDANPGTREKPFATVNRALAANRAAGSLAGGAAIELAAGHYQLAETIKLAEADSGSGPSAPLSIRAATPGTAVISGGKRLSGFAPVTDKSLLARLPIEARGKVMECNLKALGITDYGSIQEQPMVNLSVNGVLQTLARWPNSGFVRIGDMVDNGNIDRDDPKKNRPQIFTTSDRVSRWTTAPDAWLQGYLPTNWMYGYVPVGSINAQAKTITTAWCYNRLSGWPDIKSGAPYAIFNLLEEIDQPGEWYLDRAKGMLYLYPGATSGKAVVDLSMLAGTMLSATKVSHMRLEGLVFESGRGTAMDLENSSDCLIAGCTVRNMSGLGVRINGGQRNSMISCDLHDLEQGGCYLSGGGEGDSLVPAGHQVVNCRFRNFGIGRVNSAGIDLGGVGNRIAHCVFEDCPSSAIIFHGNNLRIEYNEFRNCCNEIEDYGTIYAWGNPIWRGNLWRFNKFSHCGGGYTQGWVQNRYFGTSAFRFDDAVSGQTVYGNILTHFDIWGTSAGIMSNNCGRDNIYDNNLVTDSPGMNAGYYNGGNRGGVPYNVSAYLTEFPELANLFDGKGQNFIWRSTGLRVPVAGTNAKNAIYADSDWGGWQYIANTSTGTDPGFLEGIEVRKSIDPTLFWNLGMRAIPVEEIGLYEDPTRAAWLDKPGMGAPAVFPEPGGTINLKAPLVADDMVFTAPGYTLAGTHPIIINAQETSIDVKTFGATISAPLTGLGGISVAGASTLTLSGKNTYNGDSTIKNGTLALSGGDNRLPPGTTLTLGGGGPAAVGTLKLNGCNQELNGLWTAGHHTDPGNRVINGSPTPCTLTLNIEYSRQNQFVGSLGGSGQDENNFAVRKTGSGALWLNRSITWTGGTTIEEGTMELSTSFWQGNQASGLFRLGRGATFAVSGHTDQLFFNNVTVEFLPTGGGTLINRGGPESLNWAVNGGMTIRTTGGERSVVTAAPKFNINLNGQNLLCDIARGTDATCDLLVSLPLSGDGSLTKQGNGILGLSAGNDYRGETTISAGKLALSGSLTSSTVTASGGTFSIHGKVSTTGSLSIPGEGRFEIRPGTDTLTVGGSVTLGGALDVQAPARLAPGTTFTILDVTSTAAVNGTFAGKANGSVFSASGHSWRINYSGGDGNDVTLTVGTSR